MKFLTRIAGETIEDAKTKLKIEKIIGE